MMEEKEVKDGSEILARATGRMGLPPTEMGEAVEGAGWRGQIRVQFQRFFFEMSIGQPHGDTEEAFGNRFWISQPSDSTETAP